MWVHEKCIGLLIRRSVWGSNSCTYTIWNAASIAPMEHICWLTTCDARNYGPSWVLLWPLNHILLGPLSLTISKNPVDWLHFCPGRMESDKIGQKVICGRQLFFIFPRPRKEERGCSLQCFLILHQSYLILIILFSDHLHGWSQQFSSKSSTGHDRCRWPWWLVRFFWWIASQLTSNISLS